MLVEKNITKEKFTSFVYAVGKKYAKVKGTIGDYLNQSVEIGVVYYHHNNLDSTRVMTNQGGEKVFDQDYLPFGGDLPKAGQLEVQNKTGEGYKYTGQKQVVSIGLYYYGARYYDPAVGRFTRQDSYRGELAKPQTQHLYVYVTNNPLKFTDPTGHKGVSDFITNPYEALKDAFNSMFKEMGEQSSTGNNQTSSGNGSSTQGSKGSKGKGGSIGISEKEQQKLSQLQSKARENNTEIESGGNSNLQETRSKIAENAVSLRNAEYVLGKESKKATDCSGTVYYSYDKAGVKIKRLTAQGYHNKMTKIKKSQLKPGDIVTYENKNKNGKITHIQVYVGTATDKYGQKVNDAVVNAGSKETDVYVVGLEQYNSWGDTNHLEPHYGTLLPKD